MKNLSISSLKIHSLQSFHSEQGKGTGLPLGNLTSQLLVNIYMNEFDQFVKRKLKVKHYIRYADDFVILHGDNQYLEQLIPKIDNFLETRLKLMLHPNKVSVSTLASGVDFLGWVHFPHHRVLRTTTKKRLLKRVNGEHATSYRGLLRHGNGYALEKMVNSVISEAKALFGSSRPRKMASVRGSQE